VLATRSLPPEVQGDAECSREASGWCSEPGSKAPRPGASQAASGPPAAELRARAAVPAAAKAWLVRCRMPAEVCPCQAVAFPLCANDSFRRAVAEVVSSRPALD
ncbi:unnamed protein product, partial [Polarella glacialis]